MGRKKSKKRGPTPPRRLRRDTAITPANAAEQRRALLRESGWAIVKALTRFNDPGLDLPVAVVVGEGDLLRERFVLESGRTASGAMVGLVERDSILQAAGDVLCESIVEELQRYDASKPFLLVIAAQGAMGGYLEPTEDGRLSLGAPPPSPEKRAFN